MTSASPIARSDAPIARVAGLGILSAGAAVAGVLLGGGVCAAAGWTQPASEALGAAALGGACIVIAHLVALTIYLTPGARTVARLGVSVVFASGVRMITGLLLGAAAWVVLNPAAIAFACGFLCVALILMACEAAWAVTALKRAAPARTAPRGGTA